MIGLLVMLLAAAGAIIGYGLGYMSGRAAERFSTKALKEERNNYKAALDSAERSLRKISSNVSTPDLEAQIALHDIDDVRRLY